MRTASSMARRGRARRPAGGVRAAAVGRMPEVDHRAHQHPLQDIDGWSQAHDRRHRELRRRSGGRGALPRGDRRHRCGDRRHASRVRKTPNHAAQRDDRRRHAGRACAPTSSSRSAAVRTSRARRSPARSGRCSRIPSSSRSCATARSMAAGVRGVRALDLADRHVAAAHRQGRGRRRRRSRAGGPRVPDVRLGESRRGAFRRCRQFDLTRDTGKSIAFGAGPHFCAGAAASRAMVADVALPSVFARLKGLRLDQASRCASAAGRSAACSICR